jgi:hypothetical protein
MLGSKGDRPDADIDVLFVMHGAVDDGAWIARTPGVGSTLSLENDVVSEAHRDGGPKWLN